MSAKKQRVEKLYDELWGEIQSEISKATQMLWFLAILVFVALGKLVDFDSVYKIVMTILLSLTVLCLFYTILWKWKVWHPSIENLEEELSIKELKINYWVAYQIWKEKHTLNTINLFLVIGTLLYVLVLLFFL
jgi:hypothetical protein